MTGRHVQHPSEFDQIPHGRWESTGARVKTDGEEEENES